MIVTIEGSSFSSRIGLHSLPYPSHLCHYLRYDPRDMAEILVFYKDAFLCRAICPELAGQKITLKEITQARNERRKGVRQGIDERLTVVEQFLAVHQPDAPQPLPDPVAPPQTPRLKRYLNE
jgi:putative transposase